MYKVPYKLLILPPFNQTPAHPDSVRFEPFTIVLVAHQKAPHIMAPMHSAEQLSPSTQHQVS